MKSTFMEQSDDDMMELYLFFQQKQTYDCDIPAVC